MIKAILRLITNKHRKTFKTCQDIAIDFAVPQEIRVDESHTFNNYGYHRNTCRECNFVQFSRNNHIIQELYINNEWVLWDKAVGLTPDNNKCCVRGMI